METTLVVGIITAVVTVVGWFVVAYLNRLQLGREQESAEQERKRKQEEVAKEQIRKVLSTCNRRAVYTRVHAQLDPDAMFRSLDACRSRLQ